MTPFSEEQKKLLAAPLDGGHVKGRNQGGRTVNYIEGWHAIAEANRIFGFDAWNRETVMLTQTNCELVELKDKDGKPYNQWRVGYLARVRVTVGSIVREGVGFGSGMARPEQLGDAVESAAKEAETDAMKRALMTFGNPFGLALYDKEQKEVEKKEPERTAPKPAAARPAAAAQTPEWPAFTKTSAWIDWSKAELPKMDEPRARRWEAHYRDAFAKLRANDKPGAQAAAADLLNLYNDALGRKQAA